MAAPVERQEGVKMVTHEPIVVSRQENGLKIGNREFDVEFSAVSGEMISLKYKGEEMLLAGLQPNFWRPSIDNDVPSGLLSRCIGWKEPMKNSKLLKLICRLNRIVHWLLSLPIIICRNRNLRYR